MHFGTAEINVSFEMDFKRAGVLHPSCNCFLSYWKKNNKQKHIYTGNTVYFCETTTRPLFP